MNKKFLNTLLEYALKNRDCLPNPTYVTFPITITERLITFMEDEYKEGNLSDDEEEVFMQLSTGQLKH